jgi:hypothetical protein
MPRCSELRPRKDTVPNMSSQALRAVLVGLFVCTVSFPLHAETPEPIPVKIFVVSHNQQDHGTAAYEHAVRDQLGKMPRYKLWTGSPKAFPKNGILIDIQGIDVLDANEAVIGSALIATASMQSPKEPGYSRVLVQNLLEVVSGADDVADEAGEFVESVNRRMPHESH